MRKIAICAAAAAVTCLPALAQFSDGQSPQAVGAPVASPTYVIRTTGGGGVLDVGQAFGDAAAPYVNAIAQALAAALVSWVLLQIKNKTGIEIDAQHRDALTAAAQRQASSLVADGLVKLDGVKVTVSSPALAAAAGDVLKAVPDAVKHFGVSPDELAKRIVDEIPRVGAMATALASAHAKAP